MNIFVYFVQETVRDDQGWIPCIAVEGETGYYRTDWHWDCTFKEAEEICREKNANLGFTDPKEIFSIIMGTMGYGKREQ